jgi:hypothetical protein
LQVKKKETSKSDLPQRDIRGEEKIIGSRKKMLNTEKQGAEVVEKAGQSAAFFYLTFTLAFSVSLM